MNEKNEKRASAIHPGMWVRWNHARAGRIVLVEEDGWIIVQENIRAGTLVFVRVDGDVQIESDSTLC